MATQEQVIPPHQDEESVEVGASSLSVHEEADRSHQVATAKRFPRSITKFRADLTALAIANQAVAMEMMYSLPRAGKQLIGPSIRFAEALITCWGNSRCGVEVVDVDTKEAVVVAEGRFYDCENNVGFAIRTRRRNVMTKKDADSYAVTGNAASSIALRNAILRGIPKALWADIFEKAKATAAGEAASMEKIRIEMIKLFTAVGVTESRLFAALDVKGIADIGPDEVVAMKTWNKQLREKDCTIEDIFGDPADEEINWLMDAMGWPEAKRRMSQQNFGKDRTGMLTHLREEAGKSNIRYSSAKTEQPKEKAKKTAAGPQEVKQAPADPTPTSGSAETSNTPSQGNPFVQTAGPTTTQAASPTEDVSEKW